MLDVSNCDDGWFICEVAYSQTLKPLWIDFIFFSSQIFLKYCAVPAAGCYHIITLKLRVVLPWRTVH